MKTWTVDTTDGPPQFCRGALEAGEPSHLCRTYRTVHYEDGRRYHFCDDHPAAPRHPHREDHR